MRSLEIVNALFGWLDRHRFVMAVVVVPLYALLVVFGAYAVANGPNTTGQHPVTWTGVIFMAMLIPICLLFVAWARKSPADEREAARERSRKAAMLPDPTWRTDASENRRVGRDRSAPEV